MGKYFLAWIPMVFIAMLNGALREGWYGKRLGELQAHQVSTFSGVILFGIYMWIVFRFWRIESVGQSIVIGLFWLWLTVAFEFLFGYFVADYSWSRLLQDYNIFAGRLWLAVLIWLAVAPYLFYRLQ
jgi:hypothetical protein